MANFPLVTGRQTSLILFGPTGQVVLDQLTNWEWKQDTTKVQSINIKGVRNTMEASIGWSGTFESQWSAEIDAFFSAQDANYLTAGTGQYSHINVYMTDPDGTQNAWQLINVSLKFEDAGRFEYDKATMIKVSFESQSRQQFL